MSLSLSLWFAAEMWVGHLLYHGLVNKSWADGFWLGLIASILFVGATYAFRLNGWYGP